MVEFAPAPGAVYKHDYPAIFQQIAQGRLPDEATYRQLCQTDLFFLLYFGLERVDVNHPFLVKAIREVEGTHQDTLDLWAREHYKSTILTYALPLQELILNPEERICIFSHTRPIAKGFLRQLKQTLEEDCPLKAWFPDVFYKSPRREAPKWSEDDGLVVKRRTKPKESSIEAWGLVDGQPTSKHYTIRIYDDCVTRESVTNTDMIRKTQEAYELSHSLGTDGGQKRMCGTHYHFQDLYMHLKTNSGYTVRHKPATHSGEPDGDPVLLSRQRLDELLREQGTFVFSCQQLLRPKDDTSQHFSLEWIRRYELRPEILNVAVLVDPANSKKRDTSNTAMAVIGVDTAHNKYLLDGVCHKMSLTERWKMLKTLRNKWLRQPGVQVVKVGYERYGMQADIEHFEEMMRIEGGAFPITPVSWPREQGQGSKDDRIRRLMPDHENWRFFYPHEGRMTTLQQKAIADNRAYLIAQPIKRRNHEGKVYNVVQWMLDNEYAFFPATTNKDFMDAMSRIYDIDMHPPQVIHEKDLVPEYVGDF